MQSETIKTGITTDPISISELHEWTKDEHAGAIVTFSGITRNNFDGKAVHQLSYDCYVPRAEQTLQNIAKRALEQFAGTQKIAIIHRIGVVALSEESVIIAVSAAHRGEAWEAGEWCLEEIKSTAEIWKQEIFVDGSSHWVETCCHRKH